MKQFPVTMFDEMDLSCPCRVCMECAKIDVCAWPESTIRDSVRGINASATCVPVSVMHSPRTIVRSTGSSKSNWDNTLFQESTSSSSSSSLSSSTSSSSSSRRSVRLSMDGAMNLHERTTPKEMVTLSPRRPVRRIASVSASSTNYHQNECDEADERKPKSLSRIQSMSPRTPRMQRRCSVTKFNLEDSLQLVQQLDNQQRTTVRAGLTSCPEEPDVNQRQRIRRRCSVTQYNLEPAFQQIIPRNDDDEGANSTNDVLPSTSTEISLKDLESCHGLIATPESQCNFKAKLPWGRAA